MTASPRLSIALSAPLLAGLVAAVSLPPAPALAQDFGYWFDGNSSYSRPRMRLRYPARPRTARRIEAEEAAAKRSARQSSEKEKAAVSVPAGPLFGVVSLSDQHISLYNSDGLVARSRVSTGMPGFRTPTGVFSILERKRFHRSNIYSGAPMPYMQRLTWSGIALHLGVVPGYPASHGCIRLPSGFAQQLWGMTKVGERVVVAQGEVAPVAFSHPLLPAPRMQPAPVIAAGPQPPEAEGANAPPGLTQVATAGSTVPVAAMPATPRMLNPIEYARELKLKAAADATAATKAAKAAAEDASVKAAAVRRAMAETRAAEAARNQAAARLAARVRAIETARTMEATEIAEAVKAGADAELAEAIRDLDEAKAAEAVRVAEAQEAQRTWREASAAIGAAEQLAKEAVRRVAPVSVLISKKNQRVYVRQGFRPVLDAPVTIRDPDAPIGTHLYVATAAAEDGASLRWSAVTIPSSNSGANGGKARGGKKGAREDRPELPARPASSASEALERIELPKEVGEEIAELLWLGGSIIVSDQPLSSETSAVGTDIVVTTR